MRRRKQDRVFKGHALGNDYLVAVSEELSIPLRPASVRRLCDRASGVGADGLVAVERQTPKDALVRVFNADGSTAELSGNGLRIAALGLLGRRPGAAITLRSAGRAYRVRIGDGMEIAIDLPAARVRRTTLQVASRRIPVCLVEVGNPHAVVAAEQVALRAWPRIARAIAGHPRFPLGLNVERLRATGPAVVELQIHERGVGPTLASGTGALAAVAAGRARGLVEAGEVCARMAGGEVRVTTLAGGRLRLAGPVAAIGEVYLSDELCAALRALSD